MWAIILQMKTFGESLFSLLKKAVLQYIDKML